MNRKRTKMGRFYNKLVCASATLSMIISGCATPDIQPQKPTVTNTQPQEATVIYYDETIKLIERVIPLAEDIFPQGGMMDIGKTQEGNNRYISINVLKENGVKTLEISSYIGLDSKLEAVINKYLLDCDYGAALKALEESTNFFKIGFYDYGGNDLRPNTRDFLIIKKREGGTIVLRDKDLAYALGKAEDARSLKGAYKVVLERVVEGLERESKTREKEMKTN